MKKLFFMMIAFSTIFFMLSGCGGSKPKLYVYNWSDYIKKELVKDFEKEYNCKVILDFYDSNEAMYSKLKAGAKGYDIVIPTGYMVKIMAQDGMIQEIDKSRIPNIVNIDEKYLPFTLDPEMKFSVPYMISNSGIGYLANKVDASFVPTWGIFGDPKYAGRMTMLNDMRETIGSVLRYLGYSMNSTKISELEQAGDLLISWKKNLAKFEADQYKNGLISGEFIIAHGYSGDVFQVMEENENIKYAIPLEGTTISCDNMVILKDSKNIDLAYTFINYILRPEVAAANIEYVYFLAPNKAAYELVSEEVRNEPAIFIPNELLMKSEVILDLGASNILYTRIWDKVKAAK
ncbi:MAG: spermidine/putrescine ABC transporter substrate-binding protein [Spirochaetaceae bacterium]|nr:spermidine/putrescine ABC transporter substrate-binding protein [Spirochaetaceae bacterium]